MNNLNNPNFIFTELQQYFKNIKRGGITDYATVVPLSNNMIDSIMRVFLNSVTQFVCEPGIYDGNYYYTAHVVSYNKDDWRVRFDIVDNKLKIQFVNTKPNLKYYSKKI